MVSGPPRPQFTPGKDLVPIVEEAGWAPEPVWTGGKSRPHLDSILDSPAHSQSLYRLRYQARLRIYRVARSRLTHFELEYCAGAIAYRGWWQGEQ